MTQKATHRGNCQACGRQQHVVGTGLANHGYTVEYGYFQGTCRGSNVEPLQVDRSMTDRTVDGLEKYALEVDACVRSLQAGETFPTRIQTGRKLIGSRYQPVYIDFSAGTEAQKQRAVELAIANSESEARHCRAHAQMMRELADRLHGTELVLIVEDNKPEPAPKPVVDLKAAKVHGAFGSKAARKEELDKVSRLFSKEVDKLQAIYLDLPHDQRTEAKTEVYYAPMYPHQWRPKHSAAALKEFPQAADIVAEIEKLVAAREAIKNAP